MHRLTIETKRGLTNITEEIQNSIPNNFSGVINIFIQHTSASLTINENSDPTVLQDLENWISKHIHENEPYKHTYEGPDDMPAHIKSSMTSQSLCIPINNGKLLLGTWQAIYVWEHRDHRQHRNLILTLLHSA